VEGFAVAIERIWGQPTQRLLLANDQKEKEDLRGGKEGMTEPGLPSICEALLMSTPNLHPS
jgi:hypothetical protein